MQHHSSVIPTAERQKSPSLNLKDDSVVARQQVESPLIQQKVDSQQTLSPKSSLPAPKTQPKVDSVGEQGYNVNVSLQKNLELLNVNVNAASAYLCKILGEHQKKQGYYKHLYSELGCRNIDAWIAALIETLQAVCRQRSDVVKNPGKYFYARCVALHREVVPPQTLQLVQLYAHYSYEQLLEKFQHGSATKRELPEPSFTAKKDALRPMVNTTTTAMKRQIERPSKLLPGMTRDAYYMLITQLKAAPNTKHMRTLPYQQDDGSVLLLVEDWVGNQRWIWSLEEWQQYASVIQRSFWPATQKHR